MRNVALRVGLCLAFGALVALAEQAAPAKPAQAPAAAAAAARQTRVIGEVVAVDAESRLMAVKTDAGENYTFVFEDQSTYLQVPPGEKTLEKATPIALADIIRGDRVYGRGQPLTDGRTIPVQQLIVMLLTSITRKHDADREDWDRRGILGTVVEVRARTKEIVLAARGGGRFGRPATTIVQIADKANFRRYAPDSVKFSDARPSSLADVKEGDYVRALGEKSADGATYKAAQVVSGSFRFIWGTVISVTPETNELKLKSVPGGETVTVAVNRDSVLRVMPKEFAAAMAQRTMGGLGGAGRPGMGGGAGPMGQRPPGAPSEAQVPPRSPAPGAPPQAGAPGLSGAPGSSPAADAGMAGRRSGMATGRGSEDLLERLPPTTLAEVKAGDTIMVFSTAGRSQSRVTAIAFVSGVEAILAAVPREMPQRAGRGQGLTLGMPGSALDMGMGLP